MKDGTVAGEPAEVSRQELYGAYVNFHRQLCTKVGPCRDTRLLNKAAQYLLREPEPRATFTAFPFYRAVSEGPDTLGTDCRKHLCAFIKATELLETLCVNLFLQPWKKEIKTLKVELFFLCPLSFLFFFLSCLFFDHSFLPGNFNDVMSGI